MTTDQHTTTDRHMSSTDRRLSSDALRAVEQNPNHQRPRAAPAASGVDRPPGRRRGERGQGTVEYALILLGAAAVALVVVAWVTGTDIIGRLFDTVVNSILSRVT